MSEQIPARSDSPPTKVYYVQATLRGPFGTAVAKVRFDPQPVGYACSLVAPDAPGWYFYTAEFAGILTSYAESQSWELPASCWVTFAAVEAEPAQD